MKPRPDGRGAKDTDTDARVRPKGPACPARGNQTIYCRCRVRSLSASGELCGWRSDTLTLYRLTKTPHEISSHLLVLTEYIPRAEDTGWAAIPPPCHGATVTVTAVTRGQSTYRGEDKEDGDLRPRSCWPAPRFVLRLHSHTGSLRPCSAGSPSISRGSAELSHQF